MHISGQRRDTQGGTEADAKARIGKARVAFLQLKNSCEIQRPFGENKKEDQDFQSKRQSCSSLRSRDMEDHSDYNKDDTDLCLQLSKKNPWCLVA